MSESLEEQDKKEKKYSQKTKPIQKTKNIPYYKSQSKFNFMQMDKTFKTDKILTKVQSYQNNQSEISQPQQEHHSTQSLPIRQQIQNIQNYSQDISQVASPEIVYFQKSEQKSLFGLGRPSLQIKEQVSNEQPFAQYVYNPSQLSQSKIKKQSQNKQKQSNLSTTVKPTKTIFNVNQQIPSQPLQIKITRNIKNEILQTPIAHKIHFPYQPYPCQLTFMKAVLTALQFNSDALIESPTGTGKTICLLSATLCWAENVFKKTGIRHNVLYLSRTHSQLQQVEKELQRTCLRPTMGILASRDQLCLKSSFSLLKGAEKIQACTKAVAITKKRKKNKQRHITLEKDPQQCNYYRDKQYVEDIGNAVLRNKLLTVQKIKNYGQEYQFCPYFIPHQTRENISLFLLPYSYLLDFSLLESYSQMIPNSILIFDEAHNVPDSACQGRSMALSYTALQLCTGQINKSLSHPSLQLTQCYAQLQYMLQHVIDFRIRINNYFNRIVFPQSNISPLTLLLDKNKFIQTLYEMLYQPIKDEERKQFKCIDYQNKHLKRFHSFINEFIKISCSVLQIMREEPNCNSKTVSKVVGFVMHAERLIRENNSTELDQFRIVLKKHQGKQKQFKIFQETEERAAVKNINFQVEMCCLVPWFTFQQIKSYKPKSIILTSGTLLPLQSWNKQLKIQFNVQLQNDHVIKPQQLLMRIIKKSQKNKILLDFSYNSLRQNQDKIMEGFLQTLLRICSAVPNGVLVVCPSFKILDMCKKFMNKFGLNKALSRIKCIIFQQKDTQSYIRLFKQKASKEGAVLFCVSRGKVSEGINFPDQLCRAVVMVGVPFANISDPILKQKKNQMGKIDGELWYFASMIRAVNQALGRVMRHKNDYGALFLIDYRYDSNKFYNGFPKWTKPSTQCIDRFDQTSQQQVRKFYQNMQKQYGDCVMEGQKNQSSFEKQDKKKASRNWSEIFKTKNTKKNNDLYF